ncbi:MAG: nitrous oxide reductase family maturation protein NosD [Flavobacteriaceae bacterium]|nr:nitrous oxide reductase family maturation protein NosD [Flavobacteriaceae bacterium]
MKLASSHILFLTILLFCRIANGQQIEVCEGCKVTSIKKALQIAAAGSTIIVKSGIYTENEILIDKPVAIIGQDLPTVDIQNKGYGFVVKSDSVEISGLKIINVGQSFTQDYAAIYLSRCKNFKISENILEEVTFGILVEKSHYGHIAANKISGSETQEASAGNGIHLWHSSNVEISKNEVFSLRDGIYFEFADDCKVIENYSHHNLRYGLHFMFSNRDEYHKNIFVENGAGVAVMFSKFISMTQNTFYKNWGTASYGILLKEIYDAEIRNNIIKENTIGIHVEGSTRIEYENNDFIKNGWAIKVRGACYSNHFKANNFLHNSFDLSYNSKMNDNTFEGNYWSNYSGYDLDKNGIGDVPYRPVKLFSYIVNETPETIVLLRSLFIDIIDFSEKVSPVFTPDNLLDNQPLMKRIQL